MKTYFSLILCLLGFLAHSQVIVTPDELNTSQHYLQPTTQNARKIGRSLPIVYLKNYILQGISVDSLTAINAPISTATRVELNKTVFLKT